MHKATRIRELLDAGFVYLRNGKHAITCHPAPEKAAKPRRTRVAEFDEKTGKLHLIHNPDKGHIERSQLRLRRFEEAAGIPDKDGKLTRFNKVWLTIIHNCIPGGEANIIAHHVGDDVFEIKEGFRSFKFSRDFLVRNRNITPLGFDVNCDIMKFAIVENLAKVIAHEVVLIDASEKALSEQFDGLREI